MSDTEDVDMDSADVPLSREGLPPKSSVEGYVIIATNIHQEASEEDVLDFFEDFGKVNNLHLNLDRRTGYVKGYALVEFATLEDAARAVQEAPEQEFLGAIMDVDFAFVETSKEPRRGRMDTTEEEQPATSSLSVDYVSRRDRSPERD